MNKSLKPPAVEYGKSRLANKKTGKLAAQTMHKVLPQVGTVLFT